MKPDQTRSEIETLETKLNPFKKRLRLLLVWRWGAIFGLVGLSIALALQLADYFGLILLPLWGVIMPVLAGVAVGALYGLLRPLPLEAVAAMVDKRGELKNRLQTALERQRSDALFDKPLYEDALKSVDLVRPKNVFRLKVGRWQGAFFTLLPLAFFLYLLPTMPLFNSPQKLQEKKEVASIASQIERVAKPVIEEAQKPGTGQLQKQIAKNVELFKKQADAGKLSKQDSYVKLNQLMQQSEKLETQSREELTQSAQQLESAADQMLKAQEKLDQIDAETAQMLKEAQKLDSQLATGKDEKGQPLTAEQKAALEQQRNNLQSSANAMKNANAADSQMQNLQKQLQDLQKQMQSGKDAQGNPLSKEAMEAMQKQAQSLQKQIASLKLSKEAAQFLSKLMQNQDFKDAMKQMQELAQKTLKDQQKMQNGEAPEMSPEEMKKQAEELAKKLDELAKKYGSDEQIKQLAKMMKEQVEKMKNAKMSQEQAQQICAMCMGLLGGSGMGAGSGMANGGGNSSGGQGGLGHGTYDGRKESDHIGADKVELNIPMDKKGVKGTLPLDQSQSKYSEFKAPPTTGSTSVPVGKALPSYEKSAEAAMNKQNIPPAERKRVKRYYESLKKK